MQGLLRDLESQRQYNWKQKQKKTNTKYALSLNYQVMNREVWRPEVHEVTKSQTRLSN